MRVIFLDFDGVLFTLRTSYAFGKGWGHGVGDHDPLLTKVLERVCATGIQIVVSSSWRDMPDVCRGKLQQCNLDRYVHEDWRTSDKTQSELRQDRPFQISEWLSRHPEVKDFRILDDDPWDWYADQKPHVLRCHPTQGASHKVLRSLLDWAGLELRYKTATEPA